MTVQRSHFYEVPGMEDPVTVFTEEEEEEEEDSSNSFAVVTPPPVNATNSFYESDVSLDPLDVILQLQMQVDTKMTP